jgi:predicted DNA-binding protein YlxM (UPF0122 family)
MADVSLKEGFDKPAASTADVHEKVSKIHELLLSINEKLDKLKNDLNPKTQVESIKEDSKGA